ncbi:NYN domain-containing protein [uncultured Allomuricauda sp.]|uniref:NYN domain-containing protein n=1 Tax=Flagellimonas sp. W118 TaxID=3410791 RepID=UPI002604DC6B|nr:NYN domain-containing protein [uncultured Allomuricauda sp.]
MDKDLNLAVLIDGDNIPSKYVKEMLEEIAKYGKPGIKRIYGDWTKPSLGKWKDVLLKYAITPIQQYGYTTGKNATDSAMIIDAMDILYSGKVNGFTLVSSDSDFTRLAIRLREAGMTVFGIGERKTPNPFIVACDKFIYLEILQKTEVGASPVSSKDEKNKVDRITPKVVDLILATIADVEDEEGWAYLGEVGALLLKKQPNFDPRNYGFRKLTPLVKSITKIEIGQRNNPKGNGNLIYVRSLA